MFGYTLIKTSDLEAIQMDAAKYRRTLANLKQNQRRAREKQAAE